MSASESALVMDELLEALGGLLSLSSAQADLRPLFRRLLGRLLSLTDSERGFIGRIERTAGGARYLRTYANMGWDEGPGGAIRERVTPGERATTLSGVFRKVLVQGAPVADTEEGSAPEEWEPARSPAIRTYLGLPFHFEGELMGMVGLANRPGGYDPVLVRRLQPIASACAWVLRGLEGARLREALHDLQRVQGDQAAVLDELRGGAFIIDADDRVVFASRRLDRLLNLGGTDVTGRLWRETLSLPPEIMERVAKAARMPVGRRAPIQSERTTGRDERSVLEIEVRDDPRDPTRRIIFLYEVREAPPVTDGRGLGQNTGLIGRSEAMRQVLERIEDLAGGDWTVLIEGETGVGKEVVARAIHERSARRKGPFIAVNCAGLSDTLLTSQLFGHRRGAFTGAVSDQEGMFEAASGGTILLDEIGDVPMPVQTALLRVLQEREVTRVGDSRPRPVDVRILLATHQNLQAAVDEGTFRRDLLYRIRVARIRVPSLRRRREDIPLLAEAFLARAAAQAGRVAPPISPEAMARLIEHPWPGNVRELKSAIEYATIHCRTPSILQRDLPPELLGIDPSVTAEFPRDLVVDPRQTVLDALERAGGNRSKAARLLGISRATFYRRLEELDIALDD
jgi:DNA-binding NtrC family response regulator